MKKIQSLGTLSKIAIGVVIGASLVGGVATAAGEFSGTVVNACADNSTGALYANAGSSTTCPAGRSAVTLGSGSGIKAVVPKVEP